MPEGPHLCMQMTKLKHAKIKHAEARLEPLSATSSWAKATKTERQEQHDESLHARNRICHVCAAQRC